MFIYVVFVCFRLVDLSFCIYNRTNTHKHLKNKNNTILGEYMKHTENTKTELFPSRNLRIIYSRSGRGLDIMYFVVLCFSRSFSVVCAFLFVLCYVFA